MPLAKVPLIDDLTLFLAMAVPLELIENHGGADLPAGRWRSRISPILGDMQVGSYHPRNSKPL